MATKSHASENARERVNQQAKVAKERAQSEAEEQAETLKSELGRRVFDFAEETFPDEARERRQNGIVSAFGAGLAVGFLVRHVLDR